MREIRYDPEGHTRAPRYIDHGHYLRKLAYWSVTVLVIPLALLQLVGVGINNGLVPVGRMMARLNVWSHPCLFGKLPKLPAPELNPEWQNLAEDQERQAS